MSDTVDIGGTLHVLPTAATRNDPEAKQARMMAYMEWVLLPKEKREPRTKQAVADLLGVTTATLINYDKDPTFQGEAQRRLGSVFRVDRLPNVFQTLYKIATDSENPRAVSAAKTLMDWSEQLGGQVGFDLTGYTDEQLEEARTALGVMG